MDTPEKKTIKLDRRTALVKAEHYCAYQERAQQEIRDKLYEWGLWSDDVEGIISELIETNFLNEERFTQAYVSGKFRIKQCRMRGSTPQSQRLMPTNGQKPVWEFL